MTVAATLPEAATIAAENLYTLWLADTLKAKTTAFYVALLPTFPEADKSSHPVSNWLVLIAALASDEMLARFVPKEIIPALRDHLPK